MLLGNKKLKKIVIMTVLTILIALVAFSAGISASGTLNWAGSWVSNNQTILDCLPANPITITQGSSTVNVMFKYPDSNYCQLYDLNGTEYNSGAVVLPTGNTLSLEVPVGPVDVSCAFVMSATNPDEFTITSNDGYIYLFTRTSSALSLSSLALMTYLLGVLIYIA